MGWAILGGGGKVVVRGRAHLLSGAVAGAGVVAAGEQADHLAARERRGGGGGGSGRVGERGKRKKGGWGGAPRGDSANHLAAAPRRGLIALVPTMHTEAYEILCILYAENTAPQYHMHAVPIAAVYMRAVLCALCMRPTASRILHVLRADCAAAGHAAPHLRRRTIYDIWCVCRLVYNIIYNATP